MNRTLCYPYFLFSFTVTQSEQDRSCILLLRLQRRSGDWLWVHCVLQVKDNMENSQQPVIVCTNQVLRSVKLHDSSLSLERNFFIPVCQLINRVCTPLLRLLLNRSVCLHHVVLTMFFGLQ